MQEDTVMLEILLPREIDKSPLAMEMILSNMTQSGGLGSWYARGIAGAMPTTFSLEIASLEGVVHFYIRTHKKFKELLSSNLYAHYPGVEVVEVDDYTTSFPRYEHNKNNASVWGQGFKLNKEFTVIPKKGGKAKQSFLEKILRDTLENDPKDKEGKLPADIIPIRTYIDLGLDKNKEEMKVDPLVSVLEFFGSLGKGEYAAFQILIEDESIHDDKKTAAIWHNPLDHEAISTEKLATLYKDTMIRNKKTFKKGDNIFDDYGNPKMTTVGEGDQKKSVNLTYGDLSETYTTYNSEISLTTEKKLELELITRKMSKPLLACVMRVVYVVDNTRGKFNSNQIQNCLSFAKPFNAPGFNTIGFNMSDFANPYDYDWHNPKKIRSNWRSEEVFDAFVEREGFHPHTGVIKWFSSPDADGLFYKYSGSIRRTVTMVAEAILDPFGHPHADGVFVLNTEELATLFHLPGLVATVPTLPRIDSRKAVAPVNLPI